MILIHRMLAVVIPKRSEESPGLPTVVIFRAFPSSIAGWLRPALLTALCFGMTLLDDGGVFAPAKLLFSQLFRHFENPSFILNAGTLPISHNCHGTKALSFISILE